MSENPMSNLKLWCWVLGDTPPNMMVFPVQIPLEETIGSLKNVIKEVRRPKFDHISAVRLYLYKVTVPMDGLDTLNNIDPDALENVLLPESKLSQVFAGLPTDDYLYIVVVPTPGKSVHRLSETSHYESFKRQKVVTMAPSDLATPSKYEPLQYLSTDRILDDRPTPDLDIPPIPLLYDGFGHFLDIMDGRTDIPGLNLVDIRKLQAGVDKLAQRMCRFYTHKDDRRDSAIPILDEILAARSGVQVPLVQAASIGSVRSDGYIIWRNGVVTLLTEFKNWVAGNNKIPDVELVGYVAHLHKQKMQHDEKLFRAWRVPCLGLTIVGSDVTFYALIMIDMQYRLVSLTPTLSLIDRASDGRDRQALYKAFTAASVLQDRIHGDVDRYLATPPRARAIWDTARFPAISKLRRYSLQAHEYLEFEITRRHHDQSNSWLYIAETRDSQTILIKFIQQYSVTLHEFCSKSGHAPHILAYEELPGGWKGVAMEYIETGVPITTAPELTTYRDKWTEELKKLVKSFHEIGFVHGDLRDPNIISDDKGRVFLVDFDWSGKEGEVFYPTFDLNKELLEGRTSNGLSITMADDNRVLQKTLHKLNKVAIR